MTNEMREEIKESIIKYMEDSFSNKAFLEDYASPEINDAYDNLQIHFNDIHGIFTELIGKIKDE